MSTSDSRQKSPSGDLTSHSTTAVTTDDFQLDGEISDSPQFDLEPASAESEIDALQRELYLPENDPETPEPTPQLELDGMQRPVFTVTLADGREARFQHANSLLESLEAQNIDVQYQCREGYCGSCRARLLDGEVHYTEEPLAWVDDDEILLCCCIPRGPIQLQLID